ncbi:hypothetical protein AAVH_39195 [Aphelenchoides avenae]|nr:hypothetical protein AAVH_39195 [Aphelenchus avenae]
MNEHHFLIAQLKKFEPWCNLYVYPDPDGMISLYTKNERELQLLCTQVATILGTAGFKLDGMSENKWVFVKRP